MNIFIKWSDCGTCYMMCPQNDHVNQIPKPSGGTEVIDVTKRFCQQCGLSALESWEAAIISDWNKKLSKGTIIMFREIASDEVFEWTKKVVVRINDSDSADFSKLRGQREHQVLVQDYITCAGQLGRETQSIVKLGLHNFGDGSGINGNSCWFVVAVREELHRQMLLECALVASAWQESHCFTAHSALGDGHCFFRADHMSRNKITIEPSAEEIYISRVMLADSLELNKTKIARFITTQLCCPPEATAKLTHEIESLCSARAIMHRQVDCTRPCDSFEWFGGKYNVDFHAYVHSFDVPLYVTTTGLRMVSRYGKDDFGNLVSASTNFQDLAAVEPNAVIVEHTWNYTHFIPWVHSPKRRRIDPSSDDPGSADSDSGRTDNITDHKEDHIGEISNELITASLPAALTGYDAGELGPANAATSSCISTGSSIPSADDIRIFRERLLHLVHTVIPGRRKGGRGRSTTVDTARLVFAREVVLPELYFGKFPSDIDTRMLFASHPADSIASDVIVPVHELEAWAKSKHVDPRSTQAVPLQVQQTMFRFLSINPDDHTGPRDVPRGRPPVYRFNNFHPGSKNSFAVYNGMTLHEVASFKTAVNTFKSGIDFIQWLCGGSFTWSKSLMETNILLFHELLGMEERGDALPCSRTPSNPCGAWYVKIHPRVKVVREQCFSTLREADWTTDAALCLQVSTRGGAITTQAEVDALERARRRFANDGAVEAVQLDSDGYLEDTDCTDKEFEEEVNEAASSSASSSVRSVNMPQLHGIVAPSIDARARAQAAFNKSIVQRFVSGTYDASNPLTTPSMTFYPPDPARRMFDPSAFGLFPVTIVDPSRAYSVHGVHEHPCARGGWAHAHAVTVRGYIRPRFVRGFGGRHYYVVGRDVHCRRCKMEHDTLARALELAKEDDSTEAAKLAQLERDLKAATYRSSTVNAECARYFTERYPFMANDMRWFLGHRSALDADIVDMAERTNRSAQTPEDLSRMLSEFEALREEGQRIQFAALEVHEFKRRNSTMEAYLGLRTPWEWHDWPSLQMPSLSDSKLRDIAVAMSESSQTYMDQWTEQVVSGTESAALDHSNKFGSRNVDKPYVLSGMNEWGGIFIALACSSTSFHDPATKRTLEAYRELSKRDGRAPLRRVTIDNPMQAGASLRRHLGLSGISSFGRLPGIDFSSITITLIRTEEECNAACACLCKFSFVAWDSEYIPKMRSHDPDTKSAIVQVTGDGRVVYIFEVSKWDDAPFPSFVEFMSSSVRKVAHFPSADVRPLQRRFPGISIVNVEELKPLARSVAKAPMSGDKLSTYARSLLRISMDNKDGFDHSAWENICLSEEQQQYAAADVIVVHGIVALSEATGSAKIGAYGVETPACTRAKGDAKDDNDICSSGGGAQCIGEDAVDDTGIARSAGPQMSDSSCVASALCGKESGCTSSLAASTSSDVEQEIFDNDSDADDSGAQKVPALIEKSGPVRRGRRKRRRPTDSAKATEHILQGVTSVLQGVTSALPSLDSDCDDEDAYFSVEHDDDDRGVEVLYEHCVAQVKIYATSGRTGKVRLPSGLSKDDRRKLHELCSTLGLWHASEGLAGFDTSDRTFTFEKRIPFVPLSEAVGGSAVGYVVARSFGESIERGIVEQYDPCRLGVPQWGVRYDRSNCIHWVTLEDLNMQLRLRASTDAAPVTASMPHLPNVDPSLTPCKELQSLLDGIEELWHLRDEQTTPQDLRHFLTNVMRMCDAKPGDYAWRQCVIDLADVFFKPIKGERERLQADMRLRFTDQQISRFGRSYYRRFTRHVCPPPNEQLRDFYDWYQFWSHFPHPTISGRSMFTANSWDIFKHECKYVQQGYTSDPPGVPMYVYVRTTKYGRVLYRCLRSSSQVEGWHNFLIRNTDFRAKAASQRIKDASLRGSRDSWNIRSAVAAEVIPPIYHFRLTLRDMLCDIVRDTPLKNMEALRGWRRVDQSIVPTIPVGYAYSAPSTASPIPAPCKPPLKPHSKMRTSDYARSTFGRPEASNLRSAADISSALAHPDALISAAIAPIATSSGKSETIFTASGLYPTPGAIESFPARMLEQMQTAAALKTLGHSDLRGRLYRPADSWQLGHQAGFPRFPPVQPTLGVTASLPIACFFGGPPRTSGVFVNRQPGAVPDAVAPKSRAEKDKDRQKAKRASETVEQKEQRLARSRRRASIQYARKRQQKHNMPGRAAEDS